jgi:hypothetical protein
MIEIDVLSKTDLAADPLPTGWKGANAHIGPVQAVTPLVRLISGKTTCGTVTLMSGVLLWGAARLRPFTNVDFLEELAIAVFAWQENWRYLQTVAEPRGKAPDQPVAESAAMALRGLFIRSILEPNDWHSFYQPIMPASHMINIVQFILPETAKGTFKDWLIAISDRLDKIATLPDLEEPNFSDFESEAAYDLYCAPCRGAPLPPSVLDPVNDPVLVNLKKESGNFIASLQGSKNRYLKSAAEMLDEGFEGIPYGQPA